MFLIKFCRSFFEEIFKIKNVFYSEERECRTAIYFYPGSPGGTKQSRSSQKVLDPIKTALSSNIATNEMVKKVISLKSYKISQKNVNL